MSKLAFTIREFCAAARISRGSFYNLRKAGDGPPVVKIGTRSVIRVEAAERWLRARERAALDQAPVEDEANGAADANPDGEDDADNDEDDEADESPYRPPLVVKAIG